MPDEIDTTDDIEKAGWDRRRFLKASAGGAAIAWTAPTVLGLDARAFAVGSDPDCVVFFTDFDEATPGLTVTGTVVPGVVVTQGNVDVIPSGGQFDFIPGNGLYLDLDGTGSSVPPEIQVQAFPADTYRVEILVAGSRRGDAQPNSATVTYGSLADVITLNSLDGPVLKTYNNVIVTGSNQLTISQVNPVDNQGLLILSIGIYSC